MWISFINNSYAESATFALTAGERVLVKEFSFNAPEKAKNDSTKYFQQLMTEYLVYYLNDAGIFAQSQITEQGRSYVLKVDGIDFDDTKHKKAPSASSESTKNAQTSTTDDKESLKTAQLASNLKYSQAPTEAEVVDPEAGNLVVPSRKVNNFEEEADFSLPTPSLYKSDSFDSQDLAKTESAYVNEDVDQSLAATKAENALASFEPQYIIDGLVVSFSGEAGPMVKIGGSERGKYKMLLVVSYQVRATNVNDIGIKISGSKLESKVIEVSKTALSNQDGLEFAMNNGVQAIFAQTAKVIVLDIAKGAASDALNYGKATGGDDRLIYQDSPGKRLRSK